MHTRHQHQGTKGALLIQMVVFIGIALSFIIGFTTWSVTSIKAARTTYAKDVALEVAEAGVEYYRWHMAHNATDYYDGTGTTTTTGYVHDYYDKAGTKIGEFKIKITPPSTGSTIVTITATGTAVLAPNITRVIQTRVAIPSFAQFAVVANAAMRFGVGTEVFGPIHSNGGIRFDGLAHNVISSAVSSYDDPDHADTGSEKLEYGVHTHVLAPPSSGTLDTYRPTEVPPPSAPPSRPEVFEAGRQVGVPSVDFNVITTDLATIKANAQASGVYLAPSGSQGYRVLLKTNDTFDVYRVNTLVAPGGGCTDATTGWGTWSVNTQTFLQNYAIPANGLIFVEDHVWVEGQINTARVTIGSARFPDSAATRPSITVNNDLKYTNYDGQDVIGLIAANNINVGLNSEDDLRIDAALIAQNGRVGRWYYPPACGANYGRTVLTSYGMLGTNQRYGFAYVGSNNYLCADATYRASGYCTRTLNYDSNLLYAPPPSFPLTASGYVTISWEEK